MGMFGRGDDDDYKDDGPMFGGAERYEEHKRKLERAKDIKSGMSSGLWEKDDKVWDLVKKMEED